MANTIRTTGFRVLIEALVKARKSSGLTQRELAKKLGCLPSTISDIESGNRRIDVAQLLSLSRALGLSAQALYALYEESVLDEELVNNFSRPNRSR